MSLFVTEVIVSDYLPKRADWSKCRSPPRAKRRHRQGHRQHVEFHDQAFLINGKMALSNRMVDAIKRRIDHDMMKLLMTGENVTHTYLTPNDEIATLTIDNLKKSMSRLKDDYPDIFSPKRDLRWPYR